MRVSVIIPALNEEEAITRVIEGIPRNLVHEVIVVDNGSTDRTAALASAAGAKVVREPRRGYGAACMRGIAASEADLLVFMDGDYSDVPDDLPRIVRPVIEGSADLVIGSRLRGVVESGAMPWHQRLGNRVAPLLMGALLGIRSTDLGPFRAIRREALAGLGVADAGFGWTVEMQLRAARRGLRVREVPVGCRARIGTSKISGTLAGSLQAGWRIVTTIVKFAVEPL